MSDWKMAAEEGGALRLALTRAEAAQAMGISVDSFERHVQPTLPCNYIGAKRIYAIDDIRAWLDRNAITPL